MPQYSLTDQIRGSWQESAYLALAEFLPESNSQYSCKGWPLSHWSTRMEYSGEDVAERLGRLRKSVDKLIATQFSDDGSSLELGENDSEQVFQLWRSVGIFGHEFGLIACYRNGLKSDKVLSEIHNVLVKKQKDYGHGNISRFGRIGLIIRMQDKVARLENLISKGVADEEAENESVYDSVVDVMGYSALGIMWERGEFLRQLSA